MKLSKEEIEMFGMEMTLIAHYGITDKKKRKEMIKKYLEEKNRREAERKASVNLNKLFSVN
jgi:hypothetical protein